MSCTPQNDEIHNKGLNQPFMVLTKETSGKYIAHCCCVIGRDYQFNGFKAIQVSDDDSDGQLDTVVMAVDLIHTPGGLAEPAIYSASFDITTLVNNGGTLLSCAEFQLAGNEVPPKPIKKAKIDINSPV